MPQLAGLTLVAQAQIKLLPTHHVLKPMALVLHVLLQRVFQIALMMVVPSLLLNLLQVEDVGVRKIMLHPVQGQNRVVLPMPVDNHVPVISRTFAITALIQI
jgi:hypothetical protein